MSDHPDNPVYQAAAALLNGAPTLDTAYGRKTLAGLADLIGTAAVEATLEVDPEDDERFPRLVDYFSEAFGTDYENDGKDQAIHAMARRAAWYALLHPEVAAAEILERLACAEEADDADDHTDHIILDFESGPEGD